MKEKPSKKKKGRALRMLGWGAVLPILFFGTMGVLLVALPEKSVSTLSVVTGVLLCALGVLLISGAFMGNKIGFLGLIFGVGFIAFAVWLFVDRDNALFVLLMFFLACLVLRSMLGIFFSLARMRENSLFRVELIASLTVFVFSFILFFDLFPLRALMAIVGALLLTDAAFEAAACFAKLFGRKKKENDSQTPAEPPKPTEDSVQAETSEPPRKKKRGKNRKGEQTAAEGNASNGSGAPSEEVAARSGVASEEVAARSGVASEEVATRSGVVSEEVAAAESERTESESEGKKEKRTAFFRRKRKRGDENGR